jgi:hypothetical protein
MAHRELESKKYFSKVSFRLLAGIADRETFCNARYPFGLVSNCNRRFNDFTPHGGRDEKLLTAAAGLLAGTTMLMAAAPALARTDVVVQVRTPAMYEVQRVEFVRSYPVYENHRRFVEQSHRSYSGNPRYDLRSHDQYHRSPDYSRRWDRDGDGVPNRYDARPYNPYRY